MTENRVSATLTQAERDEILAALKTTRAKLPFLVDLSVEERSSLPKLGDKSRAFVSKALEVASQNPDFLPRSFDIEEMRKDVELFESLYPLMLALKQLNELVEDTVMEVGSEAYTAALMVYNYAKASDQGAGLDGVLDEMAKRFSRKNRKKKDAPNP